MNRKPLLPVGTEVEYRDRQDKTWLKGVVSGYDIGHTKYHLKAELWEGNVMNVPTIWAFPREVRLRSKERVMEFRVDEEVEITITGSFIQAVDGDILTVSVGCDEIRLDTLEDGVTVKRVRPAEWPPQRGDLWEDQDGVRWFAIMYSSGDLVMHPDGDAKGTTGWLLSECSPEKLMEERGDLRLIDRRTSAS